MDSQISISELKEANITNEAIDDLLKPIPKKVLIDKVAMINGWEKKDLPPFEKKQSKRDYVVKHTGKKLTLDVLREIHTIREHHSIQDYSWFIYTWENDISEYFPDNIKEPFEKIIGNIDTLVHLDFIVADKKSKTVFLVLEQWKKELVTDSFLSRIEAKIPKYFRAYISVKKNMLLIQERSKQATKEFVKIFEQAYKVKTRELRINAMVIREFVKMNTRKLTKLIVKVPQEVSGFSGLTELVIAGSDVIVGSKGLMDRHEQSPILVGPWVGVSNKDLELKVGEAVKTTSLVKMLSLFDLIMDLM